MSGIDSAGPDREAACRKRLRGIDLGVALSGRGFRSRIRSCGLCPEGTGGGARSADRMVGRLNPLSTFSAGPPGPAVKSRDRRRPVSGCPQCFSRAMRMIRRLSPSRSSRSSGSLNSPSVNGDGHGTLPGEAVADEAQVVQIGLVGPLHQHQPLHRILELPNIPGPRVGAEKTLRIRREAAEILTSPQGGPLCKPERQGQNVLLPLPQSRNPDVSHVPPGNRGPGETGSLQPPVRDPCSSPR